MIDEDKPKHYSPEEIVEILHSITKLSVKDGELDVWMSDGPGGIVFPASGTRSYIPASFTRELMEMIEDHLLNGPEDIEVWKARHK